MQIDLRDNIAEVTKELSRFQKRQVPFCASFAINKLLYPIAKQELPRAMNETFKGGATTFTKRGFFYKSSHYTKPEALIYAGEKQNEYLKFQVYGGTRKPKNRSLLNSTINSPLTKQGNIKQAKRNTMIDDKKRFFKGVPKGAKWAGKENEGIWERVGRQRWSRRKKQMVGGRIRMVASYKSKGRYKPLFPFAYEVERVVNDPRTGFVPRFKAKLEEKLGLTR